MSFSKAMIFPWLLSAVVCLSFGVLNSCTLQKTGQGLKPALKFTERIHAINIVHPGDPEAEVMELDLIQKLDSEQNPIEYSLWVNSVICRDKTCDIVLVKLNWDAFGRYKSYKVKKGFELTKLDHVPFTEEDHQKLQKILLNKKSALSEATKEGLVGAKSKGVDGVAGATVLTLGEHVVLGAGYTCYDLWHWANGEVCEIIKKKSAKQTSLKRLKEYLRSQDESSIELALKSISQRKLYSKGLVEDTITAMKSCENDLVPLALNYLQEANGVISYAESFKKVLAQNSSGKTLHIVESLYRYENPPMELILAVSQHIYDFKNYQEIHRFLNYLERQEISNTRLQENVAKLLGHQKFFFSRRAYFFLREQEVSEKVAKDLEAYYENFGHRL